MASVFSPSWAGEANSPTLEASPTGPTTPMKPQPTTPAKSIMKRSPMTPMSKCSPLTPPTMDGSVGGSPAPKVGGSPASKVGGSPRRTVEFDSAVDDDSGGALKKAISFGGQLFGASVVLVGSFPWILLAGTFIGSAVIAHIML